MPNEPIQSSPYPAASAAPDVPLDIKALADAVVTRTVMRFGTAAARDAAVTSPADGMMCTTLDYDVVWRHNGTDWLGVGCPSFVDTTARDAAFGTGSANVAKASPLCLVGAGVLYRNSGTAWVAPEPVPSWQAYTPTVTGFTLGNGSIVGRYFSDAGKVTAEVLITLGSTSAVTGAITVTIPSTAARSKHTGLALSQPTGTGTTYWMAAYATAASTLVGIGIPGTSGALSGITSTTPAGSWAATGWLLVQVTYEEA